MRAEGTVAGICTGIEQAPSVWAGAISLSASSR